MRKRKIIVLALLMLCMVMYHDESVLKMNLEGDACTELYSIETEETNY
ncbi:MAG: hypothetical protein IJO60_12545 [Agathobacter sp.]|nr:hypothetical protein [Agathobacter sp.]